METGVLAAIAGLVAFAAAFAGFQLAVRWVRRRRAALAGELDAAPGPTAFVRWRVRNGYRALLPLAGALCRVRRVGAVADEAARMLEERGVPTGPERLASVVLAAALACGAVAGVAAGSLLAGVAVCACVLAGAAVRAGSARDKRADSARDAVPAALEAMAACFGSGFTLLQTFRQVAVDVPGPLGAVFQRSAHILEMGGSAGAALDELRSGSYASELAFVAVAMDVQHQAGGSMRQVLDAAGETVKGELALRRSLRVQTAQARLSARIVAVMPLLLVTAFSLASPGFLAPFFQSAFGLALLCLAVGMQVAGIFLVRRALAVEGVS